MAFDALLERFVRQAPVGVLARLALQRAVSAQWVDDVFEATAERQYTRELLFSQVVELMSLVAVGLRPSLHAAAQAAELEVSLAALYDKVKRTEPGLVRALVEGSAERLAPVVAAVREGRHQEWAEGFRVRVVDGNFLPGSQKRVKPLRGFRGAALPGFSLVVYAPEEGLVVDMVPEEDAYASERRVVPAVVERAQPGDLWLADRNFSTRPILFALAQQQACFVIREHAIHPNVTPTSTLKRVGRVETGVVFEQYAQVQDAQGRTLSLRRVEVHLDVPTEEGDTVIALLTNAPQEALCALAAARLYKKRWTVEGMFQRLEKALHSEVRTLGQPKAALFAFGCAVVAYNVLATIEAAVEVAHPQAKQEGIEVSTYFVALEVNATYGGMLVALPPEDWAHFDEESAQQLARTLLRVAAHVKPAKLRKHPRGPKKKTKKGYVSGRIARSHVSTARVLATGRLK